jgi:origin recognition complex subunit 4
VDMLEDTLAGSQNNSVLLVGPRGSGKSLVLRRALADVTARHGSKVVPVRLSGLLHSDERVALRELARQLDDRGASAAGRAAAAGLLARVSEFDALSLLQNHMKVLEQNRRSAIIVLDDFDAFAPATRKQTLLYNLMDAVQASAARAVVVGVSACCNAADMLEKRVRSRFSHRRLLFAPHPGDVLPALRRLLSLPSRSFGADDDGGAFADAWNESLEKALAAPAVQTAVNTAASFGGLPRLSATIAMHALSRVACSRSRAGVVEEQHVLQAVAAATADPFQVQLQHLPKAHLLLLVAARRLHSMRQQPVFTFGAVFSELSRLSASPKFPSDCVMPRDVALGAFESLVSAGAFEHADSAAAAAAGGAWLKEYAAYALVVANDEIKEAIQAHKALPSDVVDYLTHESVTAGAGPPML